MSPLETTGDARSAAEVAELVREAAERGVALAGPVELEAGTGWLKGSPLRGKARVRHGLRERVLRRPPPRLCELANLDWLRAHGFRAPRPLAAGVLRAGGLVTYQFLLTELVPEARTLDVALADADSTSRAACLGSLAREVARMHHAGFVHRDLFPRNLLLTNEPARGEVWFLDAWRGGARFQLRGPSYDLACLLLETELLADERSTWFTTYFEAREELSGALDRPAFLGTVERALRGLRRRARASARRGRCPLPARPETAPRR